MDTETIQYPQWPGWHTVRKIGKGGFGTVYEIEREHHGTIEKAAMKCISIPNDDSEIHEFRAEGYSEEAITKLYESQIKDIVNEYNFMQEMSGNTNIVKCDDVLEIPTESGIGCTVLIKMELLTPLLHSEIMAKPKRAALDLGIDICRALILCEQHHVIHRDIKPQNIFISNSGAFKLGDFGISRTLEKTTVATRTGSPDYMAPEVYKKEKYNRTADIYSLGLVLYWMKNRKRLPFSPKRPTISEREAAKEKRYRGVKLPKPHNCDKEFWKIIKKACAYKPEKRYQSAQEMLIDLLQYKHMLEKNGVLKPDPKTNEELKAFLANGVPKNDDEYTSARHKKWFLFLLSIVLLAGTTAGIILYNNTKNNSRKNKPTAEHEHVWIEATCNEPEICADPECTETRGEPLGHKYSEPTCTVDSICEVCGDIGEPAFGHDFTSATCTEPSTCTICGETQGEPVGHVWQEATLTSSKKCEVCGLEEGGSILSESIVGDTVTFGSYDLDQNEENGIEPMEWIILSKDDDFVYLLSKYVVKLADSGVDTEWIESPNRKWLNSDFIDLAFTQQEQELLAYMNSSDEAIRIIQDPDDQMIAEDNLERVTLLSKTEIEELIPSPVMRAGNYLAAITTPDRFQVYNYETDGHDVSWWLRTYVSKGLNMVYFDTTSPIFYSVNSTNGGYEVVLAPYSRVYGIRPAIALPIHY